MPDPNRIDFDHEAYAAGEAAFARGVSLAALLESVNVETTNPNTGVDGSAAQIKQWHTDQERRERRGLGLILGYAGGVCQAIRRIDSAINQPQP